MMQPPKQAGRSMRNNTNNALLHDCVNAIESLETAACGIVALGELMIAADPEKIEEFTLSGLGHLLTIVASAMLDDSDQFSKAARSAQQSASKTKRVRKA